jgi:hypothetical protein
MVPNAQPSRAALVEALGVRPDEFFAALEGDQQGREGKEAA